MLKCVSYLKYERFIEIKKICRDLTTYLYINVLCKQLNQLSVSLTFNKLLAQNRKIFI